MFAQIIICYIFYQFLSFSITFSFLIQIITYILKVKRVGPSDFFFHTNASRLTLLFFKVFQESLEFILTRKSETFLIL